MSELVREAKQPDGSLHHYSPYISWDKGAPQLTLDGTFSFQDLVAIVAYIRPSQDECGPIAETPSTASLP